MSKSQTPPPAVASASPAALDLAGVAVALIALAQSVAAVARFPNTPVPPSLVDRIGVAEDALRAAVEDLPGALALGVTSTAYNDDWIRERFESLDQALAEKLKDFAVAQTVAEAFAARDKAIVRLGDDLEKLSGQVEDFTKGAATLAQVEGLRTDIEGLATRLDGLKTAPVKPQA